jgi:hypothetical protein
MLPTYVYACIRTSAGATGAAWTGAFLMSLGRKDAELEGAGVPRLAEMVDERGMHQFVAAAVDIVRMGSALWPPYTTPERPTNSPGCARRREARSGRRMRATYWGGKRPHPSSDRLAITRREIVANGSSDTHPGPHARGKRRWDLNARRWGDGGCYG